MLNGSVHSAEDNVCLEVYPHVLRVCGYHKTQADVLARLLVKFVKDLQEQRVTKEVVYSAFERAIKILSEEG